MRILKDATIPGSGLKIISFTFENLLSIFDVSSVFDEQFAIVIVQLG